MSNPDDVVRYVSPFTPATLVERPRAERYLAEDERLWNLLEGSGFLSPRLRHIGRPRIEAQRLSA